MSKKYDNEFSFFTFLRHFYDENKGKIRNRYKDLSKKYLDYNDKSIRKEAFLRKPQFEALEMYVFLKEFMDNKQVYQIFDEWYHHENDFKKESWYMTNEQGQITMYTMAAEKYKDVFDYMKKNAAIYSNYIFALTMGLGKTILMATCIFYEFLLCNKYPNDKRFCHNALVFAPDKTVLESLREIITFDKSRVVPPEYIGVLDSNIKFHFLDDTGMSLNTIDGSDFNIIISNTQKIIRKKIHKEKSSTDKLYEMKSTSHVEEMAMNELGDIFNDIYSEIDGIGDEAELKSNQRYEKLTRLEQLGVYVDEAHHMFGKDLEKSITSLRQTINDLNSALKGQGTSIVACFNFTGTPYVENSVLPEVVYYYGLKSAITNSYLKKANIKGYENVKSKEFLKAVIKDFWEKYGDKTYEGLMPKMAIFGAKVDEVTDEIRPIVEETLFELGIPLSKILVNVGDAVITKDSDIKKFNDLDKLGTEGSEKQFVLLCDKGREGWNCRSLFSVALYRSPKSKIFVLQATMRCLRTITDEQQEASVYLSNENYNILDEELTKNFRVSIKDLNESAGKVKENVEVRIIKSKMLKIKRITHNYTLTAKEYKEPINFNLDNIDLEKYKTYIREKRSLSDDRSEIKVEAQDIKDNKKFSEIMVVSEVARYLNLKCLFVSKMIKESVEGLDKILIMVSSYNEILYEIIIPTIFNTLNEVKCSIISEDKDVELLRLPDGKPFYEFKAEKDLICNYKDLQFQAKDNKTNGIIAEKSFHTDNYCFDSKPEKECFLQYIFSDKIKEVYFTGMFTSQYNGLSIQYIDPETNVIRSYYPDLISINEDGTIEIIEVKGDNKIDDKVVKAKADAASEMATASKMVYRMLPSTKIMHEKVV